MAMTPLTNLPARTQDQATFNSNMNDMFSTKLPLFVTEANALQVDVGNKQAAAATSATNAANSASAAAGIASAAATSATNAATSEANAAASAASAINSPGTQATSTTSMTVGTGSKSFTLAQTGKNFVVGQWVSIADSSAPATNWMTGAITAFTAGMAPITVNVAFSSGSGTISSWVVTQATATNSLPSATGNEGKKLAVNSSAAPVWITEQPTWANWSLITSNGGTFTVPDGVSQIRAYTFGKGGDGADANGGGGGGGGGCTFGTIPCKPGDVFTFDSSGTTAVLKKGATAYLTANNGSAASGTTGGAGGAAGSVGGGLGITSSGAYGGGAGGSGYAASYMGGAGGSSGSPIGTGNAGFTANGSLHGCGGGWGCAGNEYGGGGVGSQVATTSTLSGPYAVNGEAASRDWSNAFSDPLLRPCNGVSPVHSFNRLAAVNTGPMNAPAGTGGGRSNTTTGGGTLSGGSGGLGGGGGCGYANSSAAAGGNGGFGGGGGCSGYGSGVTAAPGNGGIGGGGAGTANSANQSPGTGGSAAVIIFY